MIKFSELKVGSVLSEAQYYKVQKVVGDEVQLDAGQSEPVILNRAYVETFLVSGDQFTEQVKVNRTEMTHILINSPRVAMTVNFNKQVKETDIVKEIEDAYQNSTPAQLSAAIKKAVKRGMNGEERTMVGRHYGSVDVNGRLSFVDMHIDPKTDAAQGSRLVDPRTLNWLIVGGKKYTIK